MAGLALSPAFSLTYTETFNMNISTNRILAEINERAARALRCDSCIRLRAEVVSLS